MQDSEMRDKLEKIIKAYEELQAKMSDPAVLADQKEYNKLAKEYSDQGELVAKSREYPQACADIDEASIERSDYEQRTEHRSRCTRHHCTGCTSTCAYEENRQDHLQDNRPFQHCRH